MSRLIHQIQQAYLGQENKIAVIIDDKRYSYAELYERAEQVKYYLTTELQVQSDDFIGIVLPNNLEFVLLTLVAADMNLTLVPLMTNTPVNTLSNTLKSLPIKHVITEPFTKNFNNYPDHLNNISISSINSDELTLKRTALGDDFSDSNNKALILTMTSGSTGNPKPIVLTQGVKIERAKAAIKLYNVTASDITLIATPLYHSLAERLLFVSLLSGGTAVIMSKFDIAKWVERISTLRVTFTIAVSSQLKQIINYQRNYDADFSTLRCLVSSSALLDTHTKLQLIELLSCEFHECYGTSEIAIATNVKFSPEKSLPTVGTAIEGVDVKILAPNGGFANENSQGEIICKTPMMFSGYFNLPEKTREAFHDGYFKTGDLGYLDEKGNLFYLGRSKDVIITGGINVYPNDIDALLNELDEITECYAFPMQDERLGEVVAVAIKPKLKDINLKKISRYCMKNLSDAQQPRHYVIFDEFPKTALGKIERYKLEELANKIIEQDPSKHTSFNYQVN